MNGVLFMHWAPSLDPFGSRAKQALAIQKALNTGLSTVQVVLQHFLCFYFSLYSQWVNESMSLPPTNPFILESECAVPIFAQTAWAVLQRIDSMSALHGQGVVVPGRHAVTHTPEVLMKWILHFKQGLLSYRLMNLVAAQDAESWPIPDPRGILPCLSHTLAKAYPTTIQQYMHCQDTFTPQA